MEKILDKIQQRLNRTCSQQNTNSVTGKHSRTAVLPSNTRKTARSVLLIIIVNVKEYNFQHYN